MQENLENFKMEENVKIEEKASPLNNKNDVLRGDSAKSRHNEIMSRIKTDIYSHSRLSTFEQCKLRFKFNYIDKLETEIETSVEAFMGSRVHDTLEKLYKDLKFQKLNTLKDLLDYYNEEWEKNWNESVLIVRKEYSEGNFIKMGEKFIADYYKRFHPFNQDRTISIEQRILINVGENEEYKIQGYIDRLSCEEDGIYVVHDYKTANTLMTQEYADKDRQLALYAIAVKKMYSDCKKVKLVWHYLAFDKDVVSFRNEEQLEKLKKETAKLIKEIEATDDFPAKMSALCDWCQFKPECPNFRHMFKLENKPVNEFLDDDGVKIVNNYADTDKEIKANEKKLEKLKEALIGYAKKEGIESVYGSDIVAVIRSFQSRKFPKKYDNNRQDFVDIIKKIGLWKILETVDTYEMAKMINRNEIHDELLRLLDRFIITETTTRISLRKR